MGSEQITVESRPGRRFRALSGSGVKTGPIKIKKMIPLKDKTLTDQSECNRQSMQSIFSGKGGSSMLKHSLNNLTNGPQDNDKNDDEDEDEDDIERDPTAEIIKPSFRRHSVSAKS